MPTVSPPGPRVRVYGHGTVQARQATKAAASWLTNTLVGSRKGRNITLTICLSKSLKNREGIVGECWWTDQNIRPRAFHIRIDALQSSAQQLITLAHELVHVKQFVTGELFDYADDADKSRWRTRQINTASTPYRRLPWEVEAHKRQRSLVKQYRQFLQQRHK